MRTWPCVPHTKP